MGDDDSGPNDLMIWILSAGAHNNIIILINAGQLMLCFGNPMDG